MGGQPDAILAEAGFAETGQNAKRNWWANAREIVRVTKGKGILLGSGTTNEADLRAPRDVQNLYVLYCLVFVSTGCLLYATCV